MYILNYIVSYICTYKYILFFSTSTRIFYFCSVFDNITEGRDIYNRKINTNPDGQLTTTGYALKEVAVIESVPE